MTVTEVKKLDARLLATTTIKPDPDNPRGALRLGDLVDSVRLHGVLEPITVRPDPASNGSGPLWIIVRGHRRHAAALAAGAEVIPCLVDERDDSRQRAAHRMVENLQREDLTATEHARGVQQLLDLGLCEEDVAGQLSVTTDHVARARIVATSKVLAKGPKSLELSFDQAAAVSEFESSPKVAKELLDTLATSPEDFTWRLADHRRERQEQQEIAAKAAELKAEGYQILGSANYWHRPGESRRCIIGFLKASTEAKTRLTTKAHAKCPGRAVHVETDYSGKLKVAEYCTDWKANGHAEFSEARAGSGSTRAAASANPTPEQEKAAAKERQERRIHLACIKAGRTAEVVRRRFVSELLTRKSLPKGLERYVTEAIVTGYHRIEPHHVMFGELTGVDTKTARRRLSAETPYSEFLKALPDSTVVFGLLAYVAAEREDSFAPNNWARPGDERVAYLRFLVSAGYTPSLIEKVQLGEAKAPEVLAEAERIKATATA